jgi:hypothetical protein
MLSFKLQVRKRRELELLQREQVPVEPESVEGDATEKIFPYWRKKEFRMRALTRRIMELTKRRQLDQVIF